MILGRVLHLNAMRTSGRLCGFYPCMILGNPRLPLCKRILYVDGIVSSSHRLKSTCLPYAPSSHKSNDEPEVDGERGVADGHLIAF